MQPAWENQLRSALSSGTRSQASKHAALPIRKRLSEQPQISLLAAPSKASERYSGSAPTSCISQPLVRQAISGIKSEVPMPLIDSRDHFS